MIRSIGTIEKIYEGAAWGVFKSGPLMCTGLDLPQRSEVNGEFFDVNVGDEIIYLKDSKEVLRGSYHIVQPHRTLVLVIQESDDEEVEDKVIDMLIVKKLH